MANSGDINTSITNRQKINASIKETLLKGASAYEMAVLDGYVGTEEEWLASLHGTDGHTPELSSERTGSKETTLYADGEAFARILDGIDGADGRDGQNGQDGHSPEITATKSGKTVSIKVDGIEVATVSDGNDGSPGATGPSGADGHTPQITATKSGKVTTIKADGTTIAEINDGNDGATGATGPTGPVGPTGPSGSDGKDGQDGADGFSPTATVSKSGSTVTITITDKNGTTTAEVHDGQGGTGTIDPTPTEGSTNAVSSGGVYDELTDLKSDLSDLLDAVDDKYEKPSSGIPASDLAQGVIPDVPVTDVQVNGTTVLGQGGVANIPMASSSALGVIMVNGYGLELDGTGKIKLVQASDSAIKNANSGYNLIPTTKQHQSAFYGLAKAAGDITQSQSSNAVGTYTEEAKIAIQKMLGIYEAPWELIREDTFTNAEEADHIITVDGNGNTFELTNVIIQFELPQQNNSASVGGSGGIRFVLSGFNPTSSSNPTVEIGGWTQSANANANGGAGVFLQRNNLIQIYRIGRASSSNTGTFGGRFGGGIGTLGSSDRVSFSVSSTEKYVVGIRISAVTGTGHYKLYGKRKWQ